MAKTSKKSLRKTQIAVRIEPELREAIERVADQERRPTAAMIRNMLADWFAARTTRASAA